MKTAMIDAKSLIEKLELKPLPLEGGYFRETYRSAETLPSRSDGSRKSVSTCIYFLLTSETFSAFHRLPSDEIWHFYGGDAVKLYTVSDDGNLETTQLCAEIGRGVAPQAVVKAGDWQAAELADGGGFALLGCTVAPAFDFVDYEHGDRESLLKQFPQHKDIILKLTR
jgi:predicted cupin superfamily sugar epimerase